MLVPLTNSKDCISTMQTRPSSHQETTSSCPPSTRISTCLRLCPTFGKEIVASLTYLVCRPRCLTRFSLVRTQALFTNLLKASSTHPNQYSIGIHLSPLGHASIMRLKSNIFKSPWITYRRRLSASPTPSTIAYVTPSSLCRLSLHRRH